MRTKKEIKMAPHKNENVSVGFSGFYGSTSPSVVGIAKSKISCTVNVNGYFTGGYQYARTIMKKISVPEV